jgi:hypothetical protein
MSKNPDHLPKPGYIYIMSSASVPYLKIGQTTEDPNVRAKQLSASTSAATPFHVAYYRRVPQANLAERAIHSALAAYRVNEDREFFKVSLYEAARVLDATLVETFSMHEPRTPFSELFATFADSDDPNLDAEEQAACRALEMRLATAQ